MSLSHLDSSKEFPQQSLAQDSRTSSPSFIDNFLNSFFQEKNIKWMLVVGAAIVFGSSLMLVTKAWPQWTPALKFLTILGYTAATFVTAEVSRKRLQLNATYRVLHALTLLLMPVCFLSLTWLSPGTAIQNGLQTLQYCGLLLPAIGLLVWTSTTISDHWLRQRQGTFIVSYGLLCAAGLLPQIRSVPVAIGFVAIGWLIFTAGVVKVNRHSFWLAETHQMPRIFGFLPIALLGLQLVVLVTTKTISVLPMHWLGMAIVMVAATVLMTARHVAEVFRRRTGDLVRPLPWPIIVPLFSGLVLTVLGVGFSLSGLSYTGETTYAVIPTSILAAFLFALIARDTRHPGFVWGSLVLLAFAYQCSPTLFSDIVQTLRAAAADAMNRQRVPISMYGVTYIPLLGLLAIVSRHFANRKIFEFSRPIKHFVTVVAIALISVALTDVVSLFFVSTANMIAFLFYAIVFADRRYVLPAIAALVTVSGTVVIAVNQLGIRQIDPVWIQTVLAGLAALMTLFAWPDRWINTIPIAGGTRMLQRANGQSRCFFQWTGCVLASVIAFQWVVVNTIRFDQPLTDASLIQFGFLMAALLVYTLRNPHYLTAVSIWMLTGYVAVRWAVGLEMSLPEFGTRTTYLLICGSLLSHLITVVVRAVSNLNDVATMRRSIGFDLATFSTTETNASELGWTNRIATFSISLFDLSALAVALLAICFHIPMLGIQHAAYFTGQMSAISHFSVATPIVLAWLLAINWITRRHAFGFGAAILMPLVATSVMIARGIDLSLPTLLLTWTVVQGTLSITCAAIASRLAESESGSIRLMQNIGQACLLGLLFLSCWSFDLPMRIVGVICLAVLGWRFAAQWTSEQMCGLAILANINLLLGAAAMGGCRGWLILGLMSPITPQVIAAVFLAGSLSVLFFDVQPRRIVCEQCRVWAAAIRFGLAGLAAMTFAGPILDTLSIAAMTLGFAILMAAEIRQALRDSNELCVWIAFSVALGFVGFLISQDIITLAARVSQFALLGIAITALSIVLLTQQYAAIQILRRPLLVVGLALPAAVASLVIVRELSGSTRSSAAVNSLSLMIAAGIYFHRAFVLQRKWFSIPGLLIANAGLFLLWNSFGFNALELYLVPTGASILCLVELLRKELPATAHDPLRYIAVLMILCSPICEVLGGDWMHILALMLLSVLVILLAIGLRIRSLVYAGSAFLLVDLVAMVIRSTMHNLNLLWICGVVLGVGVIALAAFCENHREKVLSKIRILSDELASWS